MINEYLSKLSNSFGGKKPQSYIFSPFSLCGIFVSLSQPNFLNSSVCVWGVGLKETHENTVNTLCYA